MKTTALEALLRRVLLLAIPAAGLAAACSGDQSDGGFRSNQGCPDSTYKVVIAPDAGAPDAGAPDGGDGSAVATDDCTEACLQAEGQRPESCSKLKDGSGAIECFFMRRCAGRRPSGLRQLATSDGRDDVGRLFASTAELEAASVDAFLILRDELAAHGAPRKLRRAAERSARDEVRHARMMGALARRYGAKAKAPSIEERPARSLEEIAVENAVEGCVRETYGALVASYQAEASRDPGVRAVMRRVARDEARHAALGWEVARWARRRLDPEARRRVEEAQRAAVIELAAEAREEVSKALTDQAGLPPAAHAQRMIDELKRTLWA